MRKITGLIVLLFVLLSLQAFAFISDFEGEEDTVVIYTRWTGIDFPYVDGWYARVDISDSRPAEVFNAEGAGTAYEGEHALCVIFYDTASVDPGGDLWDFNSRPGEGGVNHFTSVVLGDTIRFHIWIPPEGSIDSSVVISPYAQFLSWSVWDATDPISIDSLNDLGLAGSWQEFQVRLPDTVAGANILAVGVQFTYPEVVNPDDTIYVDQIYSTADAPSGIPLSTDPNVLSLPASSVNNLSYELNAAALIHIAVYNSLGQKVEEVVPGLQEAGAYSLDIDLAPGIYICKVTAGKNGKSSKLLMLK